MHSLAANIQPLEENTPHEKHVLLRADFNVTLTEKLTISDDARITQVLPTIHLLLKNRNKIIIISHLDRPHGRDPKLSLKPVANRLQKLLPTYKVILIDDFLSQEGKRQIDQQNQKDIILLENIRFYKGEKENDMTFARSLASLGDIYVNDAFGVSHRNDASIVSLPKILPSFAGLLLGKEIQAISSIMTNPKKPFVAIIGGAKISTKIAFLSKLIDVADYLLLGGGIANTFLLALGRQTGTSLVEKDQVQKAISLINQAKEKRTKIILPVDALCDTNLSTDPVVLMTDSIPTHASIKDIGPKTKTQFGNIIKKALTIVWNGPVGRCEQDEFCRGTDFLFYSIAKNYKATSLVGGGDTLSAISQKKYFNKITHVSTGGGAMLEFIENGTLPGIEALKHN